jgi:hypothetical protein
VLASRPTATNNPFPYTSEVKETELDRPIGLTAQVVPFVEVADIGTPPSSPIATNRPFAYTRLTKDAAVLFGVYIILAVQVIPSGEVQ